MRHALIFTPDELTDTARSYLEQRFMQEDYKSYWCDIGAVLDEINDGLFEGVEIPPKFNWNKKRFALADIPTGWWKVVAFPPKVERKIKAFWKKHSEGRIEWKW